MVAGRHKSRALRRVFKRTPGGKAKLTYRKRKPSKARCAGCGGILKGTPRERPHIMKKTAKSKKRPQRAYGGLLCSKCMRRKIVKGTRQTTQSDQK